MALETSDRTRIVRLMGQAVTAWGPLTIQKIRNALGISDAKSLAGMSLAGIIGSRNSMKQWDKVGERWSFSKWIEGSSWEGEEISRPPLPSEAIQVVRVVGRNYRGASK